MPYSWRVRLAVCACVAFAACLFAIMRPMAADWNPKLAAAYLDERQAQWSTWKPAQSANGPCVSCHTGMPYLLARPALRRVLNEAEPTQYERGLLDRLQSNVGAKPPGALQSVEAIFAALFLPSKDTSGAMSADSRKAFDQVWALQQQDGRAKGAWRWYAANLDPWENPESVFYGASLAALALGHAPAEYQESAAVREQAVALTAFLRTTAQETRLHDRLALLWASSKRHDLLTDVMRTSLVSEVFAKQHADGGWTLEALGPWMAHPDVPAAAKSDSYATAFTAYVLGQAGVPSSHAGFARALGWLKAHQDPKTGAWPASSMNKKRPSVSMEASFMQDAATAFAALALIEAGL
jgi:squalene-hopene/tetraprenyl-beta-curcumene cyclase